MHTAKTKDYSKHNDTIDALIAEYPAYKKHGFMKGLKKILGEEVEGISLIPDIWAYDAENDLVNAVEVVNTNDISDEKLQKYVEIWFACDSFGIEFVLTKVSVFGGSIECDLCSEYYRAMIALYPPKPVNPPSKAA